MTELVAVRVDGNYVGIFYNCMCFEANFIHYASSVDSNIFMILAFPMSRGYHTVINQESETKNMYEGGYYV